jgi:CO/xanthine dehydrogenase FAD-binding subunit
MTPTYERPHTAETLARILAERGDRAHVLAGGTDLIVALRAGLIRPGVLVDIKGVEELQSLQHRDDGSLWIGAGVIVNRIVDDARMHDEHRGLWAGASAIATYAIRNRATVVGNVSNASPCADTVPPLCLLEAEVELRSVKGTRRMLVRDYILGVKRTAKRPDEFVAGIHVPAQAKGTRTLFAKRQRLRGHDLALCSAALVRDPERKRLRAAVGSCSPAPIVLNLDDMFGKPDAEEAARRAMAEIKPISDVRASAEYRTDMTGVLVRRLFAELGA